MREAFQKVFEYRQREIALAIDETLVDKGITFQQVGQGTVQSFTLNPEKAILVKDDYEKIPKEYINFLEGNCNNDYEFKYDTSKTFYEQEILDETKYILFGLFEKFGATEKQKMKIHLFKVNYNHKLEEQKKKRSNSKDIFKKEQNNFNIQIAKEQEKRLALIEYNEDN